MYNCCALIGLLGIQISFHINNVHVIVFFFKSYTEELSVLDQLILEIAMTIHI